MPRHAVDEKLVKDMLGEDFFYEYGINPLFKNLPQYLAQNSESGAHYDLRTPYISDQVKKLPQRDIEDFLDRDLKLNSVFRLLPAFILSGFAFAASIGAFTKFMPIGRYGVRKINQTNLYKAWGPVGVVGVCTMPLVGFYQFKQVSSYFLRLCYERIILQERDWTYKRLEELDIRNMYFFLDTPLATRHTIDKKGKLRPSFNEACKRSKQAPLPLWFKEE